MRLFARWTSGGRTSPFIQERELAPLLVGAYHQLRERYPTGCRLLSSSPEDLAAFAQCEQTRGPTTYQEFTTYFESTTSEEIQNFTGINAEQVELLRHYHSVLNSPSGSAALAYLEGLRQSLTTDQKLALVQMWGTRFRQGYDHARNDAMADARGVVDLDQLLSTAQLNTHVGFYSGGDWALYGAAVAGVCRDIASAQGQMLEALGFRDTYLLSYAKASGTFHVIVITRDPTENRQLYQLDYGSRHDIEGGSSQALRASGADIAMNYRIFKPGGRMVANIPSQLGLFLSEVAGFDTQRLDLFARDRSTLYGSEMSLQTGTGPFQLRMGGGIDGEGGDHRFIAISQSWGRTQQSRFPGQLGIVLDTEHRDAMLYGSERDVQLDFLYAQLEQSVRSRRLQITPTVQARIDSTATLLFLMSRSQTDSWIGSTRLDRGDTSIQADMRLQFDLEIEQRALQDRLQMNYVIGARISPGIADVRNNYFPQRPTAVLTGLVLSAQGRLALSRTPEGRAYLLAATTVLVDQLGVRGRFEVGVERGRVGTRMRIESRLTPQTALFQDGSAASVSADINWTPRDFIRFYVRLTGPMGASATTGADVTF